MAIGQPRRLRDAGRRSGHWARLRLGKNASARGSRACFGNIGWRTETASTEEALAGGPAGCLATGPGGGFGRAPARRRRLSSPATFGPVWAIRPRSATRPSRCNGVQTTTRKVQAGGTAAARRPTGPSPLATHHSSLGTAPRRRAAFRPKNFKNRACGLDKNMIYRCIDSGEWGVGSGEWGVFSSQFSV
jgi:hypothetical protein